MTQIYHLRYWTFSAHVAICEQTGHTHYLKSFKLTWNFSLVQLNLQQRKIASNQWRQNHSNVDLAWNFTQMQLNLQNNLRKMAEFFLHTSSVCRRILSKMRLVVFSVSSMFAAGRDICSYLPSLALDSKCGITSPRSPSPPLLWPVWSVLQRTPIAQVTMAMTLETTNPQAPSLMCLSHTRSYSLQ